MFAFPVARKMIVLPLAGVLVATLFSACVPDTSDNDSSDPRIDGLAVRELPQADPNILLDQRRFAPAGRSTPAAPTAAPTPATAPSTDPAASAPATATAPM